LGGSLLARAKFSPPFGNDPRVSGRFVTMSLGAFGRHFQRADRLLQGHSSE
jgi:hypothetical protein